LRRWSRRCQLRERELATALGESRELASVTAESRRRVEAAHADLLATLETVPAALLIFNADGGIRLRNRAATDVFGIEPQKPGAAQELLEPVQAHRQGRHADPGGSLDLGARAAGRDHQE
jgi:PAS domain-containing protein